MNDLEKSPATVRGMAARKRLSPEFLAGRFALRDSPDGLMIPYPGRSRLRKFVETSHPTFWNDDGDGTPAYVDDQTLTPAAQCGTLAIVEGESDRWALEFHGIPTLGIPGASMSAALCAEHLGGINSLAIVREPAAGGEQFVVGLLARLRELEYVGTIIIVDLQAICGVKDPADLHVHNHETFESQWQRALKYGDNISLPIQWPPLYPAPQLDPIALHGLAGEIVRYLDPFVEATPVGMLVELLAAFGCAAGPQSFARVLDDKHPGRLYVCLVGPTSTGGKGSADAAVRPFIRAMDVDWYRAGRLPSAFGSGEALLAYLGGEHAKPGEPIEKRVLLYESEFTRLLAIGSRDGATINSRLRVLWDDENLRDILRGRNISIEGAHVCIIAHVVPFELVTKLPKADIHGGSANRFLFIYVRSNKLIPNPKQLDPAIVGEFAGRLSAALKIARQGHPMERTPAADLLWESLYGTYRNDNFVGEVVARADSQRLRLSVIYALLDRSPVVLPDHVRAAEAVVKYSVDSAAFIFQDQAGESQLSQLLSKIREGWPRGLATRERHAVFGNHLSADKLAALDTTLLERGVVELKNIETAGKSARVLIARRAN
ncbi:MAG: hypothetical protein WAK16_12380 [Candidatus Cybelea sp.]